MEIHQILPGIIKDDAIGNETLVLREYFRKLGYRSEIYAQYIQNGIDAYPYQKYKKRSSKNNILFYHYSMGSDITDFIEKLPDKIILLYHNQTPEKYFLGINDRYASLLHKGRNDLKKISKIAQWGIGVSEYNRLELIDAGFKRTEVLPLLLDYEKYSSKNEEIFTRYNDHYVNILFVGRIVPNKRQDELIKIFYYYQYINPNSRLFIIGRWEGFEKYYYKLKEMVAQLPLQNIIIPGCVSEKDLNAYYSIADVFLCMSEHEGFCVPLIECMHFNIPIIAYNATAIPYTLGNSGILVNKKDYCSIAELIDIIIQDEKLKKKIIENQRKRLNDFNIDGIKRKLEIIINNILEN